MAIQCNAQENMFKQSYLLLPNNFPVGSLEARAPMPHTLVAKIVETLPVLEISEVC